MAQAPRASFAAMAAKHFLFPSIDLRGGEVVRLYQGDYDQQTTYAMTAVEQAQSYADAGASWVHLVDLDGARAGRVKHLSEIRAIAAIKGIRLEVGGGVRDEAAIDALLAVGVDRVILGTAALQRWSWFEGLMGNPGYRDRLVLGIDAKAGRAAVSGWEETTGLTALELARRVSDWPLAAIVYTDVATDGTLKGPNLESTAEIAAATRVPVVSSGGVASLDDLRKLRRLPLQGAIVGRALYEDRFTVAEAVAAYEGDTNEDPKGDRPDA